jgi:hypothetical protein
MMIMILGNRILNMSRKVKLCIMKLTKRTSIRRANLIDDMFMCLLYRLVDQTYQLSLTEHWLREEEVRSIKHR